MAQGVQAVLMEELIQADINKGKQLYSTQMTAQSHVLPCATREVYLQRKNQGYCCDTHWQAMPGQHRLQHASAVIGMILLQPKFY